MPLAQCANDVIDLPDLVLRAFARIDVRNVDDRFFRWIEDVQDVVNVRAGIEEVADVELLQVFVAVELFIVGVGNSVELCFVVRCQDSFSITPEI